MFENTTCIRCGSEMRKVPDDEVLGFEAVEFICPECGAYHTVYMPQEEEDKQEYAYWNTDVVDTLGSSSHGYDGYCPLCGNHIIWQCDYMRSEVWGDVDEDKKDEWGCPKDDSLATVVMCPHCGSNIEIVDPKPSEYSNYRMYNNKNK